jgi:hypothetical protein
MIGSVTVFCGSSDAVDPKYFAAAWSWAKRSHGAAGGSSMEVEASASWAPSRARCSTAVAT